MKVVGVLFCILSLLILVIAIGLDTTVSTDSGSRVHNIGLMNDRQNMIVVGSALLVAGALLLALSGRSQQSTTAASTPPAVSAPPASLADELRKLADLRDQGVLTESEFQSQKHIALSQRTSTQPDFGPSTGTTRTRLETAQEVDRLLQRGSCPNCDKVISLVSVECKYCKAVFGPDSTWKVKPLSQT